MLEGNSPQPDPSKETESESLDRRLEILAIFECPGLKSTPIHL